MQQRRNELDLLLHPLRKLFGLLLDRLGNLHALAPRQRPLPRLRLAQPMQLPQEHQLVDHLHLLVQPALFRQIPHPVQRRPIERLPKQTHRPRVRHRHPNHHPNRARLPRPIRPQQSKHRSRLNGQRQPLHRNLRVIHLANLLEFNNRHALERLLSESTLSSWEILRLVYRNAKVPLLKRRRRTPKDAPLTNNQNQTEAYACGSRLGRLCLAALFHLLLQLFTTLRPSLGALLQPSRSAPAQHPAARCTPSPTHRPAACPVRTMRE